jgi:hypothetical protein
VQVQSGAGQFAVFRESADRAIQSIVKTLARASTVWPQIDLHLVKLDELDEEQRTALVWVTGFQQREVVAIHEIFQAVDSDRANRRMREPK